jgi:hypothetical protein
MTGPELVITTFAERGGTQIMRARDSQGYAEVKTASVDGTKVAAIAREALEQQLRAPVVTKHRVQLPQHLMACPAACPAAGLRQPRARQHRFALHGRLAVSVR